MPSDYKLVVTSGNLSGVTGHHEIICHILETNSDGTVVKGTPETYGIESVALDRKFNGNINAWRNWVGQDMLLKHQRKQLAHAEVLQWTGKKFDIPLPKK